MHRGGAEKKLLPQIGTTIGNVLKRHDIPPVAYDYAAVNGFLSFAQPAVRLSTSLLRCRVLPLENSGLG